MQSFGSILAHRLSASTSHAIPNIVQSKYISVKIFWSFFFLLSFSLSSVMIIENFIDFFKYEVTTSIRKFPEYPMNFPTVSICNTDIFVTNYSIKYLANLLRNDLKQQLNYTKILNQNFSDDLTLVNYFIRNDYSKEFLKISSYKAFHENSSIQEKLGYSFEEMVLTCKFQKENCYKSDFIQQYNYYYGNCFIFNNLSTIKKMYSLGSDFGLELELLVGKPNKYLSFSRSLGANLYIYNQSSGATSYDKYEVPAGFSTKLSFMKTYFVKLPDPFSDCDISETIDQSDLQKNFTYSQEMCRVTCKQKLNYEKCECYDGDIDCISCGYSNYCFDKKDIECIKDSSFYVNSVCNKKCFSECEQEYYSYTPSYRKFPTETHKLTLIEKSKLLRNMILNNEDVEHKVLRIVIYSENFDYEYIWESESMQLVSVIANIGGTLGLFLGVSVLSFCEIFEILFEYFFFLKSKMKMKIILDKNKQANFSSISV